MCDEWAARILYPLAAWILLSGLDDLFVFAAWITSWCRRRRRPPSEDQLAAVHEKRIAVLLPLWQEHAVIGQMAAHNLSAIRYSNYEFFIGTYRNDPRTTGAVEQLEQRYPNVHLALVPHEGPTSKADCLNWIYQYLLLEEKRRGIRFDITVTHDAEDLIHPRAFRYINYYADHYDMVQVPVLPLATSLQELTHGVYCDEFSDYQMRDLRARELLGGFLPSSGVGTGVTRRALDALAAEGSGNLFDPGCLTEDYELGFRLNRLGFRQTILSASIAGDSLLATREYFPRSFAGAVRQRTRWLLGIVFQGWERHGWQGGWKQIYWHWRDRKGILGSLASLMANVLFLYTLLTLPFGGQLLERVRESRTAWMLGASAALQLLFLTSKTACAAYTYGPVHAIGVPFRVPWSNCINAQACLLAWWRYLAARLSGRKLGWAKTEHCYPSRADLVAHRPGLGEILVANNYLTASDLKRALDSQPAGRELGAHLIDLGLISETSLYEALSLQQNLPLVDLDPAEVPLNVARALPAHVVHRWEVLPFRIEGHRLFVARPEPPDLELERQLGRYTRLSLRFRLITRSNFDQLCRQLLNTTGRRPAYGAAGPGKV